MSSPPTDDAEPVVATRVAVVITYRSEATTEALATSLDAWLAADGTARLVVIDNSGSHETIDIVRAATQERSDRVIAMVNGVNTGFAPAVNQAVETATDRWGAPEAVVLVNPDVLTTSVLVGQVVDYLRDDTVGIAAPLLLDGEGRHVDRGTARRFWNRRTLFAEVLGAPGAAAALASPRRVIPVRPHTGPVDVDITSGAFMAIRGDLFGAGLDERLPMYLEDQEICHRAARRGLRVVVATHLVARHVGGASRRSNTEMARQLRMMELAAAPCMSLSDTSGRGLAQLRPVVGGGGGARVVVAAAVLCTAGVVSPKVRSWAREQLTLGRWFVGWSLDRRGSDAAMALTS